MSAIFDEDQQHTDPITDTLLVGGKIYVGTVGLDPVVNPINVYDNREFTGSPLGQPVIIDVNGRATNKMWVSGKYSLQIDSSADVLKYQELQNGDDVAVGNIQTSGSLGVNDITASASPTQLSYIDNTTYIVTAPADVTGAMTINIDSIGVIAIKKAHDQAIASGDLKQDTRLVMVYNATDGWMELQSGVLNSVFSGSISVGVDAAVTGDITVGGTVDGRDVAADGTRLDGIYAGRVNAAGTTVAGGSGFTSADTNTGVRTVTHSLGTANYTVVVGGGQANDHNITIASIASNSFVVNTFSILLDQLEDSAFNFILVKD